MGVIRSRSSLKGTGMGISDDIAKALLDYMDLLQQRSDIAQTWFFNGKIFCRPEGSKNTFNPRLYCDIDKMINVAINKPPK